MAMDGLTVAGWIDDTEGDAKVGVGHGGIIGRGTLVSRRLERRLGGADNIRWFLAIVKFGLSMIRRGAWSRPMSDDGVHCPITGRADAGRTGTAQRRTGDGKHATRPTTGPAGQSSGIVRAGM